MMLPLMTVAMDRIAPPRMSRATVLATVIRQIAGAFGAASAASLLLTRQQHHQATLVQTVTPDAPAVVSSLGSMTVRLLEQGVAAGASASPGARPAQRPHQAGRQRPRLRRLLPVYAAAGAADPGAGPAGAAPPPAPLRGPTPYDRCAARTSAAPTSLPPRWRGGSPATGAMERARPPASRGFSPPLPRRGPWGGGPGGWGG